MAFQAIKAPPKLDEAEALERLARSPVHVGEANDRFYAIDHPALFHWVDRAILSVLNVEIGDVPEVRPDKDYYWHIAHNQIAPRDAVIVLRWANVAALAAAFVMVYLISRLICGGHLWGFVAVVPLAFSRTLAADVGGYIKTDAYLAFFLALSLYLWLRFHATARPQRLAHLLAMGLVTGLAVSTKLNGGLLLLAYCLYLVIICRGGDRLMAPFLSCLIAFTIFVIVNPVMQHGGISGMACALREMLEQRAFTYRMHDLKLGPKSAGFMFLFMFPRWYLLPVLAVVIAAARREKWFLPVILWSLFLILGTAFTIKQPFNRYLMPIVFGLTLPAMLSAIMLAQKRARGALALSEILNPQTRA